MLKLLIPAAFLVACSSVKATPPQTGSPAVGTRRVFTLRHAPAQEVVDTITDLLEVSRRATATRNQGYCALMTPEFWIDCRTCSRNEDTGVHVVADPRRNSITVTLHPASPEDMDRVAELIQRLDVDVVRAK